MAEPIYWKVSTNLRDGFNYAVTGLADGSFTKELTKDGVNVVSPAGITITNIAASQRYDVSVSASTGFTGAVGIYHLVIYRTTIPADRWELVVVVNTDGTGAGSLGAASFTATASDGRITDGTNPLQYATVYITRPTGALYATLTSSATGVWGPVYFDANGTYGITAQRSGYTVGTGSIVVSGATATGPLADIALTAASTASTLLASAQWAYARRMYHSRNGTKADTEIKEIVDDAVDMCASRKDWDYHVSFGRINLKAAYSTGTVTVTDGSATVTLVSGTFPTWAASGDILIAGQWHTVLTRSSSTVLIMDNAWSGTDTDGSGLAYTIAQYQYDLPADCRSIINVAMGQTWYWGPQPVSRWALDLYRQNWSSISGGVTANACYAIDNGRFALWPYPNQDLMVNVLYRRKPANLTAPTDVVDWDQNLIEVLRRAIDYQVSLRGECVAGSSDDCYARWDEAMKRAWQNDRLDKNRTIYQGAYTTDRLQSGIVVVNP